MKTSTVFPAFRLHQFQIVIPAKPVLDLIGEPVSSTFLRRFQRMYFFYFSLMRLLRLPEIMGLLRV